MKASTTYDKGFSDHLAPLLLPWQQASKQFPSGRSCYGRWRSSRAAAALCVGSPGSSSSTVVLPLHCWLPDLACRCPASEADSGVQSSRKMQGGQCVHEAACKAAATAGCSYVAEGACAAVSVCACCDRSWMGCSRLGHALRGVPS